MDKFVKPYDKECMKMVLLKHEETFKEQVYELHRLYQIQKMLMKNLQSSRQNQYQENMSFSNYQGKSKIDLEQPVLTTKDYNNHVTNQTFKNDQEIVEEDECEIELTLAPTSFNKRRSMIKNKPETSDSFTSTFSSSSTGSSNTKKAERSTTTTRENSRFLSGSSDMSLKQSPWMCQVLSLNMT